MREDVRCNIVVLGMTGVGKSSLLNYLFGTEFKAGAGKPVTGEGLYPADASINGQSVRVYDSWGIEADKVKKWQTLLEKESKKHGPDKNPEEWFHAVVYCIQTVGDRVEPIDLSIIKDFIKQGYKVIVALTKSSKDDKKADEMKKCILDELDASNKKKVEIIPVCSVTKKLRSGKDVVPFGREELVEKILDSWAASVKDRLPIAIVSSLQKRLDEFKGELEKEVREKDVSGRPEGNDEFVRDLNKKIDERMEVLVKEDIKKEADRIIYGCKKIGMALQNVFNVSSEMDISFDKSFRNFFSENDEGLGGRVAGYIFSFGIAALVREFSKKFKEEEKSRIIQVVGNDIEERKNMFEQKLLPKIKEAMNINI